MESAKALLVVGGCIHDFSLGESCAGTSSIIAVCLPYVRVRRGWKFLETPSASEVVVARCDSRGTDAVGEYVPSTLALKLGLSKLIEIVHPGRLTYYVPTAPSMENTKAWHVLSREISGWPLATQEKWRQSRSRFGMSSTWLPCCHIQRAVRNHANNIVCLKAIWFLKMLGWNVLSRYSGIYPSCTRERCAYPQPRVQTRPARMQGPRDCCQSVRTRIPAFRPKGAVVLDGAYVGRDERLENFHPYSASHPVFICRLALGDYRLHPSCDVVGYIAWGQR